ncbi:hypothetical protein CDD82_3985 [Ophiocordyceps australis]|uniref:C2H2-type domain-containing protein n=1 Tax=Ophiocordyceps australis TaxID=1399860 RepID=A0A2C5Z9J9_9HYPO|nr:hypothetical protein CDD82_3985 [Ophiocordyceps australis]
MDDSDPEGANAEDGAASDEESINADGSKSGKKKKSQRFYCTDYPPCSLSFTRSEHLARHIRKHTGERPFQCHCSRRFSRLDNLRQHAQTVHVNEDIPSDSLAASGSRLQRQVRTERVRQAGNRARASTGGSAGGPPRGHSKSLSTSSIASITSVASSSYAGQSDARRRPPPLVMATDPRSRLSFESYRSAADASYPYPPPSPSDYGTPTSATFSTTQNSPRWATVMASPASSHSRSQSMYTPDSAGAGRRLSVPSAMNPFQPACVRPAPPHHVQSLGGQPPVRPVFGPTFVNSAHPVAFAPASGPSSAGCSNVNPTAWPGRRDSMSSSADETWRRRTWHPESRSYNGQPNQLTAVGSQSVRPNPAPPIANPATSQPPSSFRLPGIESFDSVTHRALSPMAVDSPPDVPHRMHFHSEATQPEERRNLNMYDASLQRGLTRLDISRKSPPGDSAGTWASEVNKAVQAQAERIRQSQPTVRFEDQLPPSSRHESMAARPMHHHQTMSAPFVAAPREAKRHGWYHGPTSPQGYSAQQNPQDPRTAHVERMLHPNMNRFSGFPTRESQTQQQQPERPPNADSLRRLEALVAVATSEGSTATAC